MTNWADAYYLTLQYNEVLSKDLQLAREGVSFWKDRAGANKDCYEKECGDHALTKDAFQSLSLLAKRQAEEL